MGRRLVRVKPWSVSIHVRKRSTEGSDIGLFMVQLYIRNHSFPGEKCLVIFRGDQIGFLQEVVDELIRKAISAQPALYQKSR